MPHYQFQTTAKIKAQNREQNLLWRPISKWVCDFRWFTQFFIFLPKAIFINFLYGGDTFRQLLNSPYNSILQKCLCIIILSKQFYENWEKMTIFGQQLTFYHPNVFCFAATQFCMAQCYAVSAPTTSL